MPALEVRGDAQPRAQPGASATIADATKVPAFVLENMLEGVSLSDEHGTILYTNPAEDRMFGYPRGELIGQHVTVQNAYPPDENRRIVSGVIAQLREHGEWSGEWMNRRKDGTVFTTRSRIKTLELDGKPHWLCVQEDITEEVEARRRAERLAESLHNSEHQLRLVTDALPALVAYIDTEMRYRFVNQAYARWFHVDANQLIGRHVSHVLGEDNFAQVGPFMGRALAGETVLYETELTLPDGRTAYIQPQYIPDKDDRGRTLGFVALVHDITARRRAELQVEAERRRLHDILMQAPFAIGIRSAPAHVFTFVNPVGQRLVNDRPLLGKTVREALPESEQQGFADLYERAYTTGEAVRLKEVPARLERDGGFVDLYLDLTHQPVRDANGHIESVVSFAMDVTDQVNARKRVEALLKALHESEARYRDFVRQSTEGIWRVELDPAVPVDLPIEVQIEAVFRSAYLAECNDAMARMYGYERAEQLTGKPLRELLIPDDRHNHEYLAQFVRAGYRLEKAESHELDRHGRTRTFQNSLVGTVENGRILRAWGTQRDITAEVEARQQVEEASRTKDEFLAMLGHELRNPLSPMLTALELMKLRDAQAFPKERAVLERQVKHLVRLVDDLLDVSRMTRGKVSIERQRLDLADVIASAVELASPLLEQRAHRLSLQVPRGLTVHGDPTRLAQVFTNLLTNAAKYTPAGGAIAVTAGHAAGGRARVSVSDSGIGIRKEILPKVFDMFVQERQTLDRAAGGLGLGLAIVRSLVELHGGAVEAHSEGPGRGSEFVVNLPLSGQVVTPLPREPSAKVATRPDGWRVLVVDDNADAADLLADAVASWGHTVEVAHDGAMALHLLERFTPDVALLDIGLPVMDGYELARRLRALPRTSKTRLLAVTGYGQPRDRAAAAEAGFDELMVKPVDLESLARTLSRLMDGPAQKPSRD